MRHAQILSIHLSLLLTWWILSLAAISADPVTAQNAVPADSSPAQEANEIIRDADYVYAVHFVWPCSAKTFAAAVDHPLVLGTLWAAYGFAPAYQVAMRDGQIHVVDPTGLVGDAVPYARSPGNAAFLVHGKLDHWAVPVVNRGSAIFRLTWRDTPQGVAADLKMYFTAESTLGGLMLRAVRPLLAAHVANRITLNIRDAGCIMESIQTDRVTVEAHLPDVERPVFRHAFGR